MKRKQHDNRKTVTFWRTLSRTKCETTQVHTRSLIAAMTIVEATSFNEPTGLGHVVMVECRGYRSSDPWSSDTTGLHTRYIYNEEKGRWVHAVNGVSSRELLKSYGYGTQCAARTH